MSVRRLCDTGHRVIFDGRNGSFVEKIDTGKRTKLTEDPHQPGAYEMVMYVKGKGMSTEGFARQG